MSESQRCPDCGQENPAGSAHCAACNFPLAHEAAPRSCGTRPKTSGRRASRDGSRVHNVRVGGYCVEVLRGEVTLP